MFSVYKFFPSVIRLHKRFTTTALAYFSLFIQYALDFFKITPVCFVYEFVPRLTRGEYLTAPSGAGYWFAEKFLMLQNFWQM